ncbi:hypothetical protein XU18_0685 [Perkinsela sp. CCAP 1560/4]|nr:histone-fold-containing protein [Perkinsela sp. CCAP 1560/4]KNH08915.1 hypothetical protein XU18_0685 [Perkinsela sp. CCAP 1560/4]|eukprot:KNH04281.1 histone-fold-containing protein [Perkinsela sp. CCAP 1560/4]
MKGGKVSSKKGSSKSHSSNKSTRHKKKISTWSTYVHRVLKEVHPNLGVTTKGMKIMNSFAEDMFDRIHLEAIAVSKLSKSKTLSARELQTSARLLLPGELSKHAMSEGTKAVAKYSASVASRKEAH